MIQPNSRWLDLGQVRLHAREWLPQAPAADRPTFLLVHGLSSNAATWDLVAAQLAAAGYLVYSIDQRGHGLSSKPSGGYDFSTISGDVSAAIAQLGLNKVILAGQSWGGNVALEVAARFQGLAVGYIFVDGGFLNLRQRGNWEQLAVELRPPTLTGTPRDQIAARIAEMHPGWSSQAISITLQNFEILPDQTVRPWLSLDRHMAILRAIYDQDVDRLFPQLRQPVLICAADDGSPWAARKKQQVATAQSLIPDAVVRWFVGAAHDIHVDRPLELTLEILKFAGSLPQSSIK